MRELIIVGAGGLGRELLGYIESDNPIFKFKGFLDDRPHILDRSPRHPGIIGTPDTFVPGSNQVYFAAIGDPHARFKYTQYLRNLDVDFGHMVMWIIGGLGILILAQHLDHNKGSNLAGVIMFQYKTFEIY